MRDEEIAKYLAPFGKVLKMENRCIISDSTTKNEKYKEYPADMIIFPSMISVYNIIGSTFAFTVGDKEGLHGQQKESRDVLLHGLGFPARSKRQDTFLR